MPTKQQSGRRTEPEATCPDCNFGWYPLRKRERNAFKEDKSENEEWLSFALTKGWLPLRIKSHVCRWYQIEWRCSISARSQRCIQEEALKPSFNTLSSIRRGSAVKKVGPCQLQDFFQHVSFNSRAVSGIGKSGFGYLRVGPGIRIFDTFLVFGRDTLTLVFRVFSLQEGFYFRVARTGSSKTSVPDTTLF